AGKRSNQPKQPVPPLTLCLFSGGWFRSDEKKTTLFAEHISEVFTPFQVTKDSEEEKKLQDYLDFTQQMSLPIKSTSQKKLGK
ncbi:reverse transcriptase, partial [Lasius niger]